MTWLRRVALLSVAAFAANAGVLAQQKFTSSTSLLTLDVSVLDRDGKPVTGLTPDDFVVTLNKDTQPVRTMVFLATESRSRTENVRATSAETPAAAAANVEPDPKLVVVMVDDVSIYPTDSKGLMVAAERFVATLPEHDWVGLASSSGQLTVNPSLDRAPLMAKLKHAFGSMNDPRRESKPYVGLMDALEADLSGGSLQRLIETECHLPPNTKNLGQLLAENQCAHDIDKKVRDNARFARISTSNQLDTYTAVIKAMAAAPGVKQLVILTGGIALRPTDSLDFIPVAKAAAAAGIQISMLMEEPEPRDKDQLAMLQQAETLAEMSGGQFFRVVGQADRFYERIITSASAVYRIGVDVPGIPPPDGQYQISVTVKRPGAKAFASRFAVPPSPELAGPASPTVPPAPAAVAAPRESATRPPPTPEVVNLLAKSAAYLSSYEKAFSVVVSEETYVQELRIDPQLRTRSTGKDETIRRERTLRSDILQTAIGQREWMAFRDVYEVDGRAVRDRDTRLQKLFVDAPPQALEQARRIVAESARYNLGSLQRNINVPTMALTFLRESNQSRSSFVVSGRRDVDGVRAIVLEFKERASPTIVRAQGADVPASGRFWIEPESGRVLKSEISIADKRSSAKITVTYGAVPKLTVWAPVVMTEEYTGPEMITAKATYAKFRQFAVAVGEIIK